MGVELPHNGWEPRDDQMALWDYLENGGKRAVEVAHRRWGKDDIALHLTAYASAASGSETTGTCSLSSISAGRRSGKPSTPGQA